MRSPSSTSVRKEVLYAIAASTCSTRSIRWLTRQPGWPVDCSFWTPDRRPLRSVPPCSRLLIARVLPVPQAGHTVALPMPATSSAVRLGSAAATWASKREADRLTWLTAHSTLAVSTARCRLLHRYATTLHCMSTPLRLHCRHAHYESLLERLPFVRYLALLAAGRS